jgi:DNA gyrase subunit A
VVAGQEGDTLVVASSTGRVLRLSLDETQLPLMGRAAQGPLLMRLLPGEQLVGAACLPAKEAETNDASQSTVVLATASGQLKRLLVSSLRPCQRGDMGQIGLRLQQRGDYLVDLQTPTSAVLGLLTDKGWSCRIGLNELEGEDTNGTGINLKLPQGQQIQELVPLIN